MSVIAIDSASRGRAWALLVTADGAVIEQREMPGESWTAASPASSRNYAPAR